MLGAVVSIECVCCGFSVRGEPGELFEQVITRWSGAKGCFNGKWEFICRDCIAKGKQ